MTPLQMALVAAAVANDGTIMQPTLVDRIVDPDGKVIQRSEPDDLEGADEAADGSRADRHDDRGGSESGPA